MSSETPVVGFWSRALCVLIFVGAGLIALVSMVVFNHFFHAMTLRLFFMAYALCVAAIMLGGLGFSLAQGRGVPKWVTKSFFILLLCFQPIKMSSDTGTNISVGKPIDFVDLLFFLTVLIMCLPDSWKTLRFHRSRET